MNEYLTVLALTALPAAANFAGGLLAEVVPQSDRVLRLALHAAAGIVIGVVGIELMEQVLGVGRPWIPILALVAGGAVAVALDAAVGYVRGRFGGADAAADAGAWMIYLGVSVDLFSDGVLIGAGSTLSLGLGLLLALGQVPADVPEGFATIATFRREGVPRRRRLLLSASLALPILLGATLSYWAVRGLPDLYKVSLLALTAGILLTIAVEEMVTQAHQTPDSRWDSLALVGGFALFALVAVYFG
ncbi:ZIP family metal transporter [Rubrivirga marina]|jgi:ZIP family zinc transporter|uniref:ZIP family zinc transporter n=1 Tax=Rubrivirga marina TaxID=1196024 RepID=A0A271IUX3_9BACT|nr:ZIP family metal transporter [Rubrivirga marina]PAP74584.1 ZIP family zinc transporter [Rubrivirga marina]